ncbi:MAG: hypothetical protein K9I59_10465 [Chlorobium sp.]|uniref:hypothetical protein n=1 Tax=Chlorobium sp. TaxID=1095 RepID=UPI0025BBE6D7|nr:hypothetical protein [Chlorobium sp.]MCF8217237.1 hypothetical protein [Chlorobium sp.]MCF8272095.1 hypothetical protein [Chlorobium sp.]MCF8288456.1 hypothetical protein [Chlorobium sp.]MCF8292046.1 hypothetical protein [Chlorobium sp.]MCF8386148.1 hypothetical protein [Chlorobium sp.]
MESEVYLQVGGLIPGNSIMGRSGRKRANLFVSNESTEMPIHDRSRMLESEEAYPGSSAENLGFQLRHEQPEQPPSFSPWSTFT